MTKKLEEVLKQAETWPEEAQEELADAAIEIAAELKGDYHATADELVSSPGSTAGLRTRNSSGLQPKRT